MKWIRRLLIAIVALACGLAVFAFSTSLTTEHPVGFQAVRANGADGIPFIIGVWYPTNARPWPTVSGFALASVARDAAVSGRDLPLVVISHGNGGGPVGHVDLALALASAGHVVAAPMHEGDNYQDQSAVGTATFFSARTRQLRATVDHMLERWPGRDLIDPDRVGAFGFSMGGFTVLTAVGAKPDLGSVPVHCVKSPEFACEVLRRAKSPLMALGASAMNNDFVADPRIKAAVVAAPGFGFALAPSAEGSVRVPVQLWSAENDDNVPYVSNAGRIREWLGRGVEFHAVSGAGHFSFLAPCNVLARQLALCAEQGKFDRAAFHQAMNASVVQFFQRHMERR